MIIEEKWDKTEGGQNVQLCITLSALHYMIYIDCNRIKCSFDKESIKNKYSDPLRGMASCLY